MRSTWCDFISLSPPPPSLVICLQTLLNLKCCLLFALYRAVWSRLHLKALPWIKRERLHQRRKSCRTALLKGCLNRWFQLQNTLVWKIVFRRRLHRQIFSWWILMEQTGVNQHGERIVWTCAVYRGRSQGCRSFTQIKSPIHHHQRTFRPRFSKLALWWQAMAYSLCINNNSIHLIHIITFSP